MIIETLRFAQGDTIFKRRLQNGKTSLTWRSTKAQFEGNVLDMSIKVAEQRISDVVSTGSEELDLSSLGLNVLPAAIANLQHLKWLFLNDNNLTTLLPIIRKFTNLEFLYLGANNFSSFPEYLFELTNLSVLSLYSNQISILPAKISMLQQLVSLDLYGNKIQTLPPEIGHLSNLRNLNLFNNKISALPSEFRKLQKLEELDLQENPLSIPPEILNKTKKPLAILSAYFGEIKIDEELDAKIIQQKPLREAKVLLVGQGSVGKTSLLKRILYNTFDQNQPKTEGISINQWKVNESQEEIGNQGKPNSRAMSLEARIPNPDSSIKLNIWDFGGQEIMHATHQFFLTKRSLYLLVLDARLTQEENRVEYWLKIIQSFGGVSPVLIVGNKTDQHPLDIDRTGLQKKYPNIVGVIETSAATGTGVEALKAVIAKQIDTLPHVRDLLPETWFTVKSKLEELGRKVNFFTQDEYLVLCDTNNIKDETSQRTLIGFLHDLGVVLHFQDEPRLEALGILNPQWVTNGVYKILNSHELFQNLGQLTLPMLNIILNLPEYPSHKRLFIVDMMKKFELCYDIQPDKVFLIPDLLPKDEPKGIDLESVPAFQYQYPVLPSSVITRFIVRMNQHITENLAWRTGVVLKIEDNRAIIKADAEDKKISIYIDGPLHKRRDALSAIRYQLDEIHESIKGLNPQKRVPIPEALNAEPLEYEYLLQLERDGFDDLPVKDGNHLVKVDVRKLLSGIERESNRKVSTSNITNIYVAGDVSGSNIIVGDENTTTITNSLFKSIYRAIKESPREETEKIDLIADINEIEEEVAKGEQADESFLSRRLRNIKKAAPDIADVVLAAFISPTVAVTTIIRNVAKKIKNET
jgi:internalin A